MISKIFPLHWIGPAIPVLLILAGVLNFIELKAVMWITPMIVLGILIIRMFDYKETTAIRFLAYYSVCIYGSLNWDYRIVSGLVALASLFDFCLIMGDKQERDSNIGWLHKCEISLFPFIFGSIYCLWLVLFILGGILSGFMVFDHEIDNNNLFISRIKYENKVIRLNTNVQMDDVDTQILYVKKYRYFKTISCAEDDVDCIVNRLSLLR